METQSVKSCPTDNGLMQRKSCAQIETGKPVHQSDEHYKSESSGEYEPLVRGEMDDSKMGCFLSSDSDNGKKPLMKIFCQRHQTMMNFHLKVHRVSYKEKTVLIKIKFKRLEPKSTYNWIPRIQKRSC